MGENDNSSLPRYGWSGTNQQFGIGGGAKTPTKTLYGNAGKAVVGAGAAGLLILENNANTTIEATPFAGFTPGRPETGVEAARERYGDDDGNKSVKTVTPDIEINNLVDRGLIKKDLEAGELEQLFLTDIGGRELISLSRHDQINGINQEYSPIKNLSDISLQYNPLAISPNADNVTTYLTSFNFDITKYVPTQQELDAEYPLETDASKRAVVYFDKETNSLNVHVKNIFVNEKIEVEFIVPEEVKDGTIYT
jgi:hypothetical protein